MPQQKKGWFNGVFFKEEDIGLNSVKEVSKTVDTNISKITQFLKQRQHYVQYFLYGSSLFAVTFLTFYYQSIKVSKQNLFNTITKQKNMISKKSIAYQAFNNEVNFPNNNLKVFKGKMQTENTLCYKHVFNYYKNFKEFTRYPLLLIGQTGVGKTELLRNIFNQVRFVQSGEILYVDLDIVTRQAGHLSDILFYKYPQYKHYQKIFQHYSQEIAKPTILIDNFHLLSEFPQRNTILEQIQYYRWIQSFNFLFTSQYRQPNLSYKINLIQRQFQGSMQPVFYQNFVKSLNLGSIQSEVLLLRPNIIILQDLYLCPQSQRQSLFQSIKYRIISQIQYFDLDTPSKLQKFKNHAILNQQLLKAGFLKDGLLRYDKNGNLVYGSQFIHNLKK